LQDFFVALAAGAFFGLDEKSERSITSGAAIATRNTIASNSIGTSVARSTCTKSLWRSSAVMNPAVGTPKIPGSAVYYAPRRGRRGGMDVDSPLGALDIALSVAYSALFVGFLVWSYFLVARTRTRK